MRNKKSGNNFSSAPQRKRERRDNAAGEYNTSEYYRYNEALGDTNYQRPQSFFNDDQQYNDLDTGQYDNLNTSKYENFNGGGYYGSNYGSINESNVGRDFEQNAGYRDNYNRLTTGQWPELERAAQSRGVGPQRREENNRGLHKGKGPRSYQRSDMRIREDVHDRLLEDPYIDATDVEVAVTNGDVVLSGVVDDRQAKRRAEDILEDIPGIKHLENRLRVRLPGGRIVNILNSEKSTN
jgi:osmotically-inducible protein OsmY